MASAGKITPTLWFDGNAEEAANFYVSVFPDSRVDRVFRSPADTPSGPEGMVLLVEFTVAGQRLAGLNGGPEFPFTEAVSLSVDCADQAEVDRYWDALTADGGQPVQCGWLKDKYGLSWQIVPSALPRMLADPDRERAKRVMQAMLDMVKLDMAKLQAAYDGR
jgi:predicted 3-demethylubiquinone-9 3-methyltransferase (glyoxalase superfamily)